MAYRWFCRLDLDDKVPHHSTVSENRLHRFRESDVFRHIFERVVAACMAAGLVKGEGFAVDATVYVIIGALGVLLWRALSLATNNYVRAEIQKHPHSIAYWYVKVADRISQGHCLQTSFWATTRLAKT